MNNKVRQSGLELLRIIAMLLIIGHHFAVHGGGRPQNQFNDIFFNLISIGGKIGVNVFFMISAYFLCDKEKISLKGIIRTIVSTVFYSLLIFTVFSCVERNFSLRGFIESLLSFVFQYWFVLAYLIFMIVVPLFAKLIKRINRQAHLCICIIGFAVLSIVPAIIFGVNGNHFDTPIFFFYLIFPLSYIKFYGGKTNKIAASVTLVVCYAIGTAMGVLLKTNPNVLCANTILNFLSALMLFLLFKDLKFTNKFINLLGGTTFAVYLIHDNPYVRNVLWKFVNSFGLSQQPYWFVFCIATILAIYVMCTLIEFLRLALFKIIKKALIKLRRL